MLIDQYGQENQTAYPCFDRNSLIQLIEAKSLSWHYYQASRGRGYGTAPTRSNRYLTARICHRRRDAALAGAQRHRLREPCERRLGNANRGCIRSCR